METSIKYAIDDQAEIDLIYQKLTEALKLAKQQARPKKKK
jgi:predicted 3-demethylubiquinone-9 3-methyltransferase (glyoxalase superfamily)